MFETLGHFHASQKLAAMARGGGSRRRFHQRVYARLFCAKDKEAACFSKQISQCFFIQKLCWLCHSQVALNCAGCHLQVAVSCAQKSLKKAMHKNVNEIDPSKEPHSGNLRS